MKTKVILGRVVDSFGHKSFMVTIKAESLLSEEASCKALKSVLGKLLSDDILKEAVDVVVEKSVCE